jgi:hypothetical protein
VTCISLRPSDTVWSTFPLKRYIPENTFTRHDSSGTLIFICATADSPNRLYSLLPNVTVRHWIAHEFSNITHFMEGRTFVKRRFMSHVSGVRYLLAASSTYRQDTTASEWYKSSEKKIWRFMMAGCNKQVVEDIIRSFQCLSVCYWPLTHNKHTVCLHVIAFCFSAQYHKCSAIAPFWLFNTWRGLRYFLIALVCLFCFFLSKCFFNLC